MDTALAFDVMPKRLTIDVPDDLHEAFLRKCFLSKPRKTMKQAVIEFMAHTAGKPVPEFRDRRKMTRAEREAFDRSPRSRPR